MKLSIITINWNNKSGLEATGRSVLQQTFLDFEYLVIDGGSTDGSVEVIKQNNILINYWISEPDNGVYCAMNKGIVKANGDYCLFLNSGDVLLDDNVLTYVFAFESNEDIIYGNIESNKLIIQSPTIITLNTLRWGTIAHPAAFIKRQLLIDNGLYSEQYKVASDWEFWMKAIIIKNCSYKYLPVNVSNVEPAGISGVIDPEHKEGYSIIIRCSLKEFYKIMSILIYYRKIVNLAFYVGCLIEKC